MTYEAAAKQARQQPYVWTALRTDMATANLVTEIRKGKHDALPPSQFEARSFTTGTTSGGNKRYGIEIRFIPEKKAKPIEQNIEKLLREAFEKMLPELVRNIADLKEKDQK